MKSLLITSLLLILFMTGYAFPAQGSEILKVVSYNVQARPFLDNASGKLPDIGIRLTDFDLVGIQELFVYADKLANAAGKMNFCRFAPKRHIFKIVNSGLAILSKYPIESVHQEYFEQEGSFENVLGSKGIFMARIRIADQILDLYTTHLAAGREKDSGAARRSQTEQIIRFIKTHSPADHAVILTGDFNWRVNKLQSFSELSLTHAADKIPGAKPSAIDHIFFRSGKNLQLIPQEFTIPGESFKMKNGEYLSDHHPVMAVFRISTTDK